jgi:hypothetical protein
MNWEPFSLHFKQVYDGGYRYLDHCGELMVVAEEKLNLLSDEVNPTGCKMSLPESGIGVVLGTTELTVTQEFYRDDGAEFVELCQSMADLVWNSFRPRHVESNGFASKAYCPFTTSEGAMAASLRLSNEEPVDLSRVVDMPARQRNIDSYFEAGSLDLHLQIHPVTFQSMTVQRHTAPPKATEAQKRRIERLNKKADRLNTSLRHGIMMELDLIEANPPTVPLVAHYELLRQKEEALQLRMVVS